eukprot:gb/GECH01007092.1/.p1 GENE.gb/GECH01007092.1/~~gb/GECH01007092.1/.p1  ORF type:complete len:908 (+),score=244.09 gb/GECH01007092.1/:1-2724(+)
MSSEEETALTNQQRWVHLIDDEGNFANQSFGNFIVKENLEDKGNDYLTLAIFGGQSSGKSTLLNMLFSTDFPTMNASIGRTQTTKGIMLSKAKASDLVILDMEGTDSIQREKSESELTFETFERKLSLFGFAVADAIIVNINNSDIGRFYASNYSLLRIVFELDLQLFAGSRKSKTLLIFAVRDYDKASPFESLIGHIRNDISSIWEKIAKPDEFADSKETDFFNFEFIWLPHKNLCPQEFEERVDLLKPLFLNPSSDGYVFRDIESKNVPIDGLEHYALNIWDTIQDNKDLDIPTQKEMVARYRCEEISNECLPPFSKNVSEWQEEIDKENLINDLGSKASSLMTEILEEYDKKTHLYMKKVVKEKRTELEEKMNSQIKELFMKVLTILHSKAYAKYQTELTAVLPSSDSEVISDFSSTCNKIQTQVKEYFETEARNAMIPEEDWDYMPVLRKLIVDIGKYTQEERKIQLNRLLGITKKLAVKKIEPQVKRLITDPPEDMWPQLRDLHQKTIDQEKSHLQELLSGFDPQKNEVGNIIDDVSNRIKSHIKKSIKTALTILSNTMMNRFSNTFRYNENNLPIVWQNVEHIHQQFNTAKSRAVQILDIFFLNRMESEQLDDVHLKVKDSEDDANAIELPSDIDRSCLLLSEEDSKITYVSFMSQCKQQFAEAQREMLEKRTQIPKWFWILILALGWNEIVAILTRPWLFLLMILVTALLAISVLRSYLESYVHQNPILRMYLEPVLQKLPNFTANFTSADQAESHDTSTNQSPTEAQDKETGKEQQTEQGSPSSKNAKSPSLSESSPIASSSPSPSKSPATSPSNLLNQRAFEENTSPAVTSESSTPGDRHSRSFSMPQHIMANMEDLEFDDDDNDTSVNGISLTPSNTLRRRKKEMKNDFNEEKENDS